jgi:hypothetical protein
MPNLKEEASMRKVQETQKINIGIEEYPKYVNLRFSCTQEEINQHTSLFEKLFDVFAWTYDDFHHIISLK